MARVAWVTGGGRGIGRAIATALSEARYKVVVSDIDEVSAREVARGVDGFPLRLDVRDAHGWAAALQEVEAQVGAVDVLVNNAGVMPLGRFVDGEVNLDRRQFEVNYWGVVHGMRAVLPGMRRRGGGWIVNVASVSGKVGTPHAAVYAAAKHAVVGLTESVRAEVEAEGVRMLLVIPGMVDTELNSGVGRPRWPRVIRAEEVGRAVIRGLKTGARDVYVPRSARWSSVLPAVLPRSAWERFGRWMGVETMFAEVDDVARQAYAHRLR